MIQQIILGVWVCLATLGGIYGADFLLATGARDPMSVRVGGITYSKMLPMSVPVLRDGELDGYVVAQFVYGITSQNASSPISSTRFFASSTTRKRGGYGLAIWMTSRRKYSIE